MDAYGQAVESVLMKYGKGIVNEQFVLNRLANAAIDIYTSTVVLSRATRSINEKIPSSNQEKLMTQVWCYEVKFLFIIVPVYMINIFNYI